MYVVALLLVTCRQNKDSDQRSLKKYTNVIFADQVHRFYRSVQVNTIERQDWVNRQMVMMEEGPPPLAG